MYVYIYNIHTRSSLIIIHMMTVILRLIHMMSIILMIFITTDTLRSEFSSSMIMMITIL